MSGAHAARLAGSRGWDWLLFLSILVTSAAPLAGQVPDTVPADTIGQDTIQVAIPPEVMVPDTLPTDTAAVDSAVPVPPFPRFVRPGVGGWAFGRWEWDRAQLLRYHSLSLLQLVERIPGMVAFRSGDFGQPAGLAALGHAGARIRVYLDGFEIDPLGFTTADLQQIALGDLEGVHIERRLDGIRIDLTPLRLPDARPLSAIEAATGVYDTKLLRGLLMRGLGRRSTLLAAFDQASSRGFGFNQAFSFRAARAAVSYALGERTALQLDYRAEAAESREAVAPIDAGRRTIILRGRSEPFPGLTLDAMAGSISRNPEASDPLDVELASRQGAVRAAYDLGRLWMEASTRLRSDADAGAEPQAEMEARAGLLPMPWLIAEGQVRSASIHGAAGTEGMATLRVGPLAGLSAFGTLAFGDHALALVRDTTIEVPIGDPEDGQVEQRVEPVFSGVSSASGGVRVGAEWAALAASVGVAGFTVPSGRTAPFGFTTVDRGLDAQEVEEARGFEVFASVPVPLTGEYVRVEGWYTRWTERGGRPYVPEQSGRIALQAHGLFFGGELEPSLRIEAVHHGSALVPDAEGTGFAVESQPYELGHLQLQIRIQDLRAFFIFDNVTNIRGAADLPDRPLPGARFYYGLRWTFRN